MPVTARLSKAFYERLGEQVTNELVAWFNDVDATYRTDLRELNELNFARFDAKLEQRIAQVEAKIEQRFAQFEVKIEQRLAQFEVKFEQRLAQFEVKFEQRLAWLDAKWEKRFAQLDAKIETRAAATETRLLHWMFAFWTGNLVATAGIVFAVMRLGR